MAIRPPCFLDCEASSLHSGSYPTEVGWSLPDGTIKSMLINPYHVDEWTDWSFHAQQMTGISREMLREEGHHPKEVALALNADLKGRRVFSDAPEADDFWIKALFDAAGLQPEFVVCHIWIVFKEMLPNENHLYRRLYEARNS